MSESNALLKEFILESNDSLGVISECVTKLEKNPTDSELLNALYRAVHTVKGGSRFLKLDKLEVIAHALENPLDLVREGKLFVTSGLVDVLLVGADLMTAHLKCLDNTGVEDELDPTSLLLSIAEFMQQQSEPIVPKEEIIPFDSASSEDLDNNFASIIEEPVLQEEVKIKIAKKDKVEPRTDLVAEVKVSETTEKNVTDSVVRVNVDLLDKIMNVVGELVLTRNQILQYATSTDSSDLQRLSTQLNTITTELQGDIMTTRMQPIGGILTRFERIVRDMARDLGKKVSLKIEGKDTELDKTLLEAIKDPLTHMVRNAVDHGIETIDDRKKAGKPEQGTLQIRAYHEGGQVTIEIGDDGRGINRQKILKKALEKGILTSDAAEKMTDREILGIIFYPGFSTAAQVTNISGRGVGMDVVKTNVEKIGGQVDISSEDGVGTTLKMRIPLTLAIIPALVVEDSGEAFAIPQINLVELVRLEGEKLALIEKINEAEFFRLRGELIPLMRLREVLELKPKDQNVVVDAESIAILSAEGLVYGLIVDSILDTQEIVVKPLSKQLKAIGTYAGATIMGDGRVALILDALGLGTKFSLKSEKSKSDDKHLENMNSSIDTQEILTFRLNSKGLYGVPLVVVHRLEEFPVGIIEYIGETQVIQYRGQPMPLIRIEETLGLHPLTDKKDKEIIPVFVTSFSGKHFGFVVEEIMDIAMVGIDLKTTALDKKGLLGSVSVNDKLLSLIDVFWIAEKMNLTQPADETYLKKSKQNKKPVVLIAEDTPLFRRMAIQTFSALGFEVHLGEDGVIALEKLKELGSTVDLIVSDIEMPNMNGLEFVRAVRKIPAYATTPCIALTSRFSKQDIDNGLEAGFDRYLEKFKKDEILAVVTELIGKNGAVA
ncbi:MAG: chemotaxis protein CheW [Pseudobdellovibrio sp.]